MNIDRESATGRMLHQYLQEKDTKLTDEGAHLLFSVNRWEMRDQILSDLEKGITLICDRYAYSGVAYSAAKVVNSFYNKDLPGKLFKSLLYIFYNTKLI